MAAPCSSVPANSHRGTLLLSTQWAHDKAEEEWALDEGEGEWEEGEWEEGEWEAEEGIPPRASPAAKPNQHVRFPSSPKHLVAAEDDADAEIHVFDARGVLCERRGDTPARHKHEGRAAKRAREEMEAELARELAEEMEVELDAEMDSEIDSEIEAEIEAEIESDIEAEEEMQAEIEEEIEAEMEAELTHEILGDADARRPRLDALGHRLGAAEQHARRCDAQPVHRHRRVLRASPSQPHQNSPFVVELGGEDG